jgi:hypothetical protein
MLSELNNGRALLQDQDCLSRAKVSSYSVTQSRARMVTKHIRAAQVTYMYIVNVDVQHLPNQVEPMATNLECTTFNNLRRDGSICSSPLVRH